MKTRKQTFLLIIYTILISMGISAVPGKTAWFDVSDTINQSTAQTRHDMLTHLTEESAPRTYNPPPPVSPEADNSEKNTDELLKEAELLNSMGYRNAAIAIYLRILEKEPKNKKAVREFGDMLVVGKDYANALKYYQQYLELEPNDTEIQQLVVDIYFYTGSDDNALFTGLKYLKRSPENRQLLSRLIEIAENGEQPDVEIGFLEYWITLEPDDEEARRRLLDLYIHAGTFEKAENLLNSRETLLDCPPEKKAYVLLKARKFNEALELYHTIYNENPTEDNLRKLNLASAARAEDHLRITPTGFGSLWKPTGDTIGSGSPDPKLGEIAALMRRELQRVYAGYEYNTGRSSEFRYYRNFMSAQYPIVATGTGIGASFQDYRITGEGNTGIYRQTGIRVDQRLARFFSASAGVSTGEPGTTYFGRLAYNSENIGASVVHRRDYHLQTSHALANNIHYTGNDYNLSWNINDRLYLFGGLSNYDFSDNNHADYHQIGAFYQIWNNRTNAWANVGVFHTGERYRFTSPLYYSPDNVNQLNFQGDINYYWTDNSLLRLSYIHSRGNNNENYNVFSIYADHKFSDNFFLYAQYMRGLSRAGRIILTEQPASRDYDITLGAKVRF